MPDFNYQIKKSKIARRLKIMIYHDGRVVVTLPFYFPAILARKFVDKKSDWIKKKLEYFSRKKLVAPVEKVGSYKKNKETARAFVLARVGHFNQFFNFRFQKIFIKNQKTVWGSCSRRGNLNFNYKILFLPPELQDYIIVHELCHLGELNHSARFWKLVEKTLPDYLAVRKNLKRRII
ncbi:MAG: M48 family metallopeptidase [Candidatus Vogelbacteria bacterium]|nr:M48 family metallopeptidase [Candidatus Vogelbacteria bacterium]